MTSIGALLLGPLRCAGCGVAGAASLCESCGAALRPAPASGCVAPVGRIVAAWEYAGAARALVLRLKLGADRHAAGPLADGMARAAARSGLTGSVIAWVPGRPRDIRRRGFDHAEVLARAAATRLGLPCRALVVRRGDRPDQTSLGAAERRRNPAGAFEGRTWASPVVLADDLVTTGATASACAAALLAAGVPAVEVLVPCRA